MSRRADLRVYFKNAHGFARAAQFVVDRKQNLYGFPHGWPIPIKLTHHAGGHTRSSFPDTPIPDTRPKHEQPWTSVTDFQFVDGLGMGSAPEPSPLLRPKADSRKAGRKSLVVPSPRFMWGIDLWAIATGRTDIAQRISETKPYPKSEVAGSLLADWLEPMLLIAVWQTTSADAYTVYKYSPSIPGRVPFEIFPSRWEGTWLDDHFPKQASLMEALGVVPSR